jgi:hypothetical protein
MSEDRSQLHELPAPLPEGERVIWRGRPSYKGLALRSFHVREAGIYVGLLLAWRLWSSWSAGAPVADMVAATLWIVILGLGGIGLLLLLAWQFRRASTYTLTDRRVLFQFGAALPMSMNIPLSKIASVDLKTRRDGTGDIPIKLLDSKRVSYILMWPHIRPWRLTSPEPMFVSVPDAAQVATKFAEALAALPASSVQPIVAASNSGPSGDPLGNPPAPVAA